MISLASRIENYIAEGHLCFDQQLPDFDDMMGFFGVDVPDLQAALNQLTTMGRLLPMPRSRGYDYVIAKDQPVDMASGHPAYHLVNGSDVVLGLWQKVAAFLQERPFSRSDRQQLAKSLKEKLAHYHGEFLGPIQPEAVTLVPGVYAGMEALVTVLMAQTKSNIFLVESPGWPTLFDLIRYKGGRVLPVGRTEQGIDLKELEQKLALEPAAMIINTLHQNPTGVSLPVAQRAQVADLLHRHGTWLIEDDVFRDMAFDGQYEGASIAHYKQSKWALVGSLCKKYSRDTAVGWILQSGELQGGLSEQCVVSHIYMESASMYFASLLLEPTAYASHLKSVRTRLAARARLYQELFQQSSATTGGLGSKPTGGLFMRYNLPSTPWPKFRELGATLAEAGMLMAPANQFYPGGPMDSWFRLNLSSQNFRTLGRFVEVVAETLGH